jgi:glutathione S-transferase/GST-like protein
VTLQLHYFPTPNGQKVTIALEEMGLAYDIVPVDILANGQDDPGFRAINPNGRIPALVDSDVAGGPVAVFESAAILQYLGRKTGQFYPADEQTRSRIDSWLFWQMAGLGPMSGQVNFFLRAAEKPGRDLAETSFTLHRFRKETARLFAVLDRALQDRDHLCGEYSIADMCAWTWIDRYPENGGGLENYPGLGAWHARIAARPAVQRALAAGADILQRSLTA